MDENPFKKRTPEFQKPKQEQLEIGCEVAKPEDWPELAAIRLEALEKDPKSFIGIREPQIPDIDDKAKWKSYLDREERFILFAKQNSNVVGFAGAYIDYGEQGIPEGEGVWCTEWAYVKPEFRRQGVGEKMYKERLEEIKRRGGNKVIVFVLKANENFDAVVALNKKLGFEEIKQTPERNYIKLQIDLSKT